MQTRQQCRTCRVPPAHPSAYCMPTWLPPTVTPSHTTPSGTVLHACAEDPTWWPEADLEIVEGTRLGAAAAHQRDTLRQLAAWRDRLLQLRRRGRPVLRLCQWVLLIFSVRTGSLAISHSAFLIARAQLACLRSMKTSPPGASVSFKGMSN